VNLVQLVVLLTGFAIAIPAALSAAGGWESVVARAPADPAYWSLWRNGSSGWMYLALLGPAFVISPGLLQKIFGARDDRAVRMGTAANALVLLAFAFVPPLLGIMARGLHPDLESAQAALPTLLVQDVPPLIGSIGLAALFSAEVSTADAILFMLATSLSQDLYKRSIRPQATDADVLRVARWAAVAGGGAGVALALVASTIIGTLQFFYSVMAVCLFVPLLGGLYVRRVGTTEALAATVAGMIAMLALQLGTEGQGVGALTPAMLGLATAVVTALLVLLVRRAPASQGRG
jgi:SSS family solute:Na+ symporter